MPKRKPSSEEADSASEFSEAGASEPSTESHSPNDTISKRGGQKDISTHVHKKSKNASNGSSSVTSSQKPGDSSKILTNEEGDRYIDLGKKKRAVVRTFKGMPLVDIREYYVADGKDRPGKKGISLTFEQWEALREASSTIDELLAEIKAA